MSLRAVFDDAHSGYGVTGIVQAPPTASIMFDLRGIADALPLPSTIGIPPDQRAVRAYMINMQWRVKVIVNNPDFADIKRFDDRIGLSKYGQIVFSDNGYKTNREFIDFDRTLSGLYFCKHLRLNLPEDELPLPCDEPPVDLDLQPLINTQWFPQSGRFRSNVPQIADIVFGGAYPGNIASKALIVPENNTVEYGCGITYVFAVTFYDEEDYVRHSPNYISV